MYVIKRDGIKVNFDSNKIYTAMMKAYKKVYGYSEEILTSKQNFALYDTNIVTNRIINMKVDYITVEEIQDMVEEILMKRDTKVAKEYILYRDSRNKARAKNMDIIKKVSEKINANNIENSNANVDEHSFSGREKEASSELSKMLALKYDGLEKEVAEAHKEMIVYQHDLEKAIYGIHNCLNLNFQEIFKNGFSTRNGDVRPPASFSTGCQLVAVAFQCQSQVC